jgi:hypothetical protein
LKTAFSFSDNVSNIVSSQTRPIVIGIGSVIKV